MWGITSGTFPLTFKETKANDGGFSSHVRKLTLDPGNHIANGLYKTSRWRIMALQDGYVPPLGFALPFLTQTRNFTGWNGGSLARRSQSSMELERERWR